MRRKISLYISLLVLLVISSCGESSSSVDNFNIPVYTPEYSQGFSIWGAEGMESTVLRVNNPWQGSEAVSKDLFISRNGEKAPAGFKGEVIDAPAERVVCMSSTYVAMLDVIGKVSSVVGVSGIHFITNEYVKENRDKIGDVGYDGNINFEVLVALDPDIVLIYGVNGSSLMETKLKELGIPFAYVGEYVEELPLGKSEWLVAVSEIVDSRGEGTEIFREIAGRYNGIKERVSPFSQGGKPKVMINTPYGDSWFMASTSSYVARLIDDAGGEYLYKMNDSNESKTIDMEMAALLINQADVWINIDSVNSIAELSGRYPKFADAPCVVKGNIYRSDRRSESNGGNDYWESGVVYPDAVLADLAKAFYPDKMGDVEFTYYRKLE